MFNPRHCTYFIVTTTALLGLHPASAGIYKTVNSEGTVTYSDESNSSAENVKLAPLSIYSNQGPPPPSSKPQAPSPDTAVSYTVLNINQPTNEATIWDNNGKVAVQITLKPKLAKDDQLQILIDGHAVATSSEALQFVFEGLDRGTHMLQAQIIRNKKTIKTSPVITFYVHKAISGQGQHLPVTAPKN